LKVNNKKYITGCRQRKKKTWRGYDSTREERKDLRGLKMGQRQIIIFYSKA
jgi:hypothetical protein